MRKIAALTTALVASAGLASAATASGGNDIRNAGTCTGSSTSKIKDNGSTAFDGKATTRGASGSFSVEKKITDQSGSDAIKATAKNKGTGERCSASATV